MNIVNSNFCELNRLPLDVQEIIFSYLEKSNLTKIRLVSKEMEWSVEVLTKMVFHSKIERLFRKYEEKIFSLNKEHKIAIITISSYPEKVKVYKFKDKEFILYDNNNYQKITICKRTGHKLREMAKKALYKLQKIINLKKKPSIQTVETILEKISKKSTVDFSIRKEREGADLRYSIVANKKDIGLPTIEQLLQKVRKQYEREQEIHMSSLFK